MLKIVLLAIIALNIVGTIPAVAGPCDTSDQRARDGSRCGDRAADRRPGGK
jgi:hypothetical protein